MAAADSKGPPSGTIAMLFTDIEGSTRLAHALPDQYEGLLNRHRAIIRAAYAKHDGYEVGTDGDSFFVTFDSPLAALATAVDAQRALAAEQWPSDGQVAVRMGLHLGEARLQDGDYVGVEVHRAARIAAAGHGGQVLLSATMVAVIGDRLPGTLRLRDLGEYRLKDFDAPVRIHGVTGDGLRDDAAPIGAPSVHRGNLPERRASFVGRVSELDALIAAISANRLVTLTGPGGTGKTSLGVESARRTVDGYRDGVWLVELASLQDPEFLLTSIYRALGVADDPARAPIDSLADYLAGKEMLLVLDNLEQLLPDAAPIVDELLGRTSGIRLLVTSREPLHLSGEQEFPVEPLRYSHDEPDQRDSEAALLFAERAKAVDPSFALTDTNRQQVELLVRRLDGLPLAIELAAARVKLLEPAEIMETLSGGSTRLAGTGSSLPERQRTLHEAIDWSYRLLSATEQGFFARLSVFAGGCGVADAEAVCNPGAELGIDTLDALASLVDKSLLRRTRSELGSRFEQLATIRDFATERLAEHDPAGSIGARHAHYMVELAERAAPELTRPGDARTRMNLEIDNFRAALAWAIQNSEFEVGARLVAALWRFWHIRALLPEGREWSERVLAIQPTPTMSGERVRALYAAGSVAYWQRDKAAAEAHYRAGLAGAQALGDRRLEADGWVNLLYLFSVFDELTTAHEAQAIAERIHELSAELDDPTISAHAGFARAGRLVADGKLEEARATAETTLRVFEATGDVFLAASANNIVGGIALAQGKPAEALPHHKRAAELFYSIGDEIALTLSIRPLATVAAQLGDSRAAARLAGFAARLVTDTGISFTPPFEPEDALELARTALGDEPAQAEWEAGRQMSRDQAMDLVRSL